MTGAAFEAPADNPTRVVVVSPAEALLVVTSHTYARFLSLGFEFVDHRLCGL